MDQGNTGRRPHYHRGRRGSDRRGAERRPNHQPPADPGARDTLDVEQIMREIRARISQRHGIDLAPQQIQELAARRLEAILDPRTIKPGLLEQLRRSAAEVPEPPAPEPGYVFEDSTLYESNRKVLRLIRTLLNPLLKLFFNPNPLIHALNTQARINRAAAEREAEREQRQAEWNALHFEILQRLVTEVSRVSLEVQALALKVESLAGKVDFNERRVRGLEGAAFAGRLQPPRGPVEAAESVASREAGAGAAPAEAGVETARRRRRRRRSRRGGGGAEPAAPAAESPSGAEVDEIEGLESQDVAGEETSAGGGATIETAGAAEEGSSPDATAGDRPSERPTPPGAGQDE